MHISRIQIESYKSFRKTPEIHLTTGFNVIVGQNNAGKTALLESIGLNFQSLPHKSLETVPAKTSKLSTESLIKITFKVKGNELVILIKHHIGTQFFMPILKEHQAHKFLKLLRAGSLELQYTVRQSSAFSQPAILELGSIQSEKTALFEINENTNDVDIRNDNTRTPANTQFQPKLTSAFLSRIYSFKAERLNIAESATGNFTLGLKADASNLPQVLHHLSSSNPTRFNRYKRMVQSIFEEIQDITIPTVTANTVHILLWSIDPKTERDDLAIKLAESGTGIGQVLAILYVILMADEPQIIIIDEPQSFLHPGAIRKLFSILKANPQHQYIISTHSPTVIAAANPQNVLLVRKEGAESVIEQIDLNEINKGRQVLLEVGARPSDVFGADDILWVEGPTEEQCFPLILEKVAKHSLLATSVIGVTNTGDYDQKNKRDAERIIQIYNKLSEGRGLMPPAIGFVFDHEGRSTQKINELKTLSSGAIHFTPRKMFENYLLNPDAIACILSNTDEAPDLQVEVSDVATWLDKNKWDKKYITQTVEKDGDNWLQHVDGARLLKDVFNHLSDAKIPYDKVAYGTALTEWIIENAPEELQGLANFLVDVIEDGRKRLQGETESEE